MQNAYFEGNPTVDVFIGYSEDRERSEFPTISGELLPQPLLTNIPGILPGPSQNLHGPRINHHLPFLSSSTS